MRKLSRHGIRWLNPGASRLWFALFFALISPAFGVTFTASLDRTSIVFGEQVVLSLTFDGAQPTEISNPRFDGLQAVSGLSSSSRMVVTPNSQSTVYTYTIALEPVHAGQFVIPPISAKVNGQVMSSQPLTLRVAAVDPSTTPPAE